MGRVKSRTRKPFVKGQKKSKFRGKKVEEDARSCSDVEIANQQKSKPERHDICFDLDDLFSGTQSASAKKLSSFIDLMRPEDNSEHPSDDSYVIVKQSLLKKLISKLLYPSCSMSAVTFRLAEVKLGLAAKGLLNCDSCSDVIAESYLCDRFEDSESNSNDSFDINVRSILAFRGIGCGYESIQQWLALINMPCSPV